MSDNPGSLLKIVVGLFRDALGSHRGGMTPEESAKACLTHHAAEREI
jgi:hypothetical protein